MKTKSYTTASDFSVNFEVSATDKDVLTRSHCHDKYEILYITSGTGKYVVEGVEYPVRPRTLMFIRPFEYHYLVLDPDVEYARYCIHFTHGCFGTEIARLLDCMAPTETTTGNYYSSLSLPGDVDTIFDRFDNIEMLTDDIKRIYIRSLLVELVVTLSLSSADKLSSDKAELGARVIRYLNSNIDKDVSLDKLARRFFVSKYHLCRAFKKYNGISVHGYVNHKRVMYAKQLIESGETASGAAYKVGFGDYSAFYRAYVRIIGKAPTQDGEIKLDV